MQGRYPRTVREFADNNRHVLIRCSECAWTRNEPADVLEAMFGPDFDLYDGFGALTAELRCDRCGKKHRLIIFRDTTPYPNFGPVSTEDALNRELERRAYVRARGEESTAVRGARRRRS
jgi:RNase P subunit RPR2